MIALALLVLAIAVVCLLAALDYRHICNKPTRVELEERDEDWAWPDKQPQIARYIGPKGRERL